VNGNNKRGKQAFACKNLTFHEMRTLLCIIAFFVIAVSARAQGGFYIKAGAGYAFALPSANMGENSKFTYLRELDPETGNYVPAFIRERSVVKGSPGAGITASMTAGYNLSDILSIDASFSYLRGNTYKTSSVNQDVIFEDAFNIINTERSTVASAAKAFLISPSIVLTVPNGALRPYVSAGPVLGFFSLETRFNQRSDYDGDHHEVRHEKYSGGISVGMRGAVGISFTLNSSLSLFAELGFSSLRYAPKEKEVTRYEINDQNLLTDMDEQDRRTLYVKHLSSDTRNDNYNDRNRPTRATPVTFDMSSLMTSVGVKINI
jgi:hypothetical protein